MIQRQTIECFRCQTPVDKSDLDCVHRGREIALELEERRRLAFLLRCTSFTVVGGAALSAFIFEVFLAGFAGYEKTLVVGSIFTLCVAGLVWLMADWFRPTRVVS